MKSIFNLMRQDLVTALRDNIVLYMIVAPLILALLVGLFLPSVESTGFTLAISEQADGKFAGAFINYGSVEIYESDDEVIERVEQTDAVPGLILRNGIPVLIFEGNEPGEIVEAGEAVLTAVTASEKGAEFRARSVGESSSLFREILVLSLLMLALLLGGVISAFNMIDEKESRAVNALAVTPLGTWRYITARALGAVLAATAITAGTALILTGQSMNYPMLILAVAASTPIITAIALTVGGLAGTQVSAIAVIKVLMPLYMALPIVSLFVPDHLQALFYPLPNYWQFQMLRILCFGGGSISQFWTSIFLTVLLSAPLLLVLIKYMAGRLMLSGGK